MDPVKSCGSHTLFDGTNFQSNETNMNFNQSHIVCQKEYARDRVAEFVFITIGLIYANMDFASMYRGIGIVG